MELLRIKMYIERNFDVEPQEVALLFEESFTFPKIVLSEQEVTDLQKFFGVVFDYVIKNNKLIQFDLIDNKNDMFNEISYSDNGIGISENKEEKNGFTNIRSRLRKINADMTIDKNSPGLKLLIKHKR